MKSLLLSFALILTIHAQAQTSVRVETDLVLENIQLTKNLANPREAKELDAALIRASRSMNIAGFKKGISDFKKDFESKKDKQLKELIADFKPTSVNISLGLKYRDAKASLIDPDYQASVKVKFIGSQDEVNRINRDNNEKMQKIAHLTSESEAKHLLGIGYNDKWSEISNRADFHLEGVALKEDESADSTCSDLIANNLNPFSSSLLEKAIDDLREKEAHKLKELKALNRKVSEVLNTIEFENANYY